MWELKKINNVDYFFNIEVQQHEKQYKFCLTDFCKLWCVQMSENELVDHCKEINSWLEADDETMLSQTLDLFNIERDNVQWSFSSPQLSLESTFSGIKFIFNLSLQLADTENYFKIVISPLFLIIKNLQEQKEFLHKFLKKKDIEIAEYKLEGAVISRKNVETPVFHEELLPNLTEEKLKNLSFSKPSDLIDDHLVSLYNETYARINKKNEITNTQPPQKETLTKTGEKSPENVKVPKKNESDSVTKPELISVFPVTSANVIRKKPQPRKLKNL